MSSTAVRWRGDPDAIWKEVVRNEEKAVDRWAHNWEYSVDEYRQLGASIRNVQRVTIETKLVNSVMKDHPKYPVTSGGHIGWLANDSRFALERFGQYSRPINTLYKTLNWPIEASP